MSHIINFWINQNITNTDNRHQCCGCTVCESVCSKNSITMHVDKEGFVYPLVDETKCVECSMCTKVCPVINKCVDDKPYLKSFAGYSTDQKVIEKCASGGVVTSISKSIIKQGGVVFGVRFSSNYNMSEYCIARTEQDLWKLCSSKYIQPNKLGIHKEVKVELQKDIPVLFIGCPCDVAALKRYLKKDYDNLLTCELFCAGITSKKILDGYREIREKKQKNKLVAFNVRNKEKGWFVQHIKEEYENGKVYYKNHFGTYLGYGFLTFRRPSCYHCQYKQNVTYCDIKCGDFWGIKDTDPFWNLLGVSVILAKTQKGVDVLKSLKKFNLYEIDHTRATINNDGFMGKFNPECWDKRNKFAKIFIDENKGLSLACIKTAPWSFWVKYFVPSSYHTFMKKIFHLFIDKN